MSIKAPISAEFIEAPSIHLDQYTAMYSPIVAICYTTLFSIFVYHPSEMCVFCFHLHKVPNLKFLVFLPGKSSHMRRYFYGVLPVAGVIPLGQEAIAPMG